MKKRILILLLIALILLGVCSNKIRWRKETKVDEQTIYAIADMLNKYDSRHKLIEVLRLNGNPFDLSERDLVDGLAFCPDYKKGIAINTYYSHPGNYCSYLSSVDSEEDLELYLDAEVGKCRPLFNLKSNWYEGENYKCWLSPNMKRKNDLGFTEYDDHIVAIFFLENYVLMLQQIDQGGNAAFDEYLSWFLDLIQTNQPTVL
jgi:hypothetical protein